MESLIKFGQQFYSNKDSKSVHITLGYSGYLVITMAAIHLVLGTALTAHNLVGNPLTCMGSATGPGFPKPEEYCLSEYYYIPIGFGKKESDRQYSYFRVTQWILVAIGKCLFIFF